MSSWSQLPSADREDRPSFKIPSTCPYNWEGGGECYIDNWYQKKTVQINDMSRQNYLKLMWGAPAWHSG